ncbi:MAG TPA: alpha/beta hydrolase [Mucilaginibacter sp.]|jgi:proline iminopeptidase
MKTTILNNKKTKLFAKIYPKSNCESVVLLHGGPGVPDDLTMIAEFLSGKFQVITFHQRGTGMSPCSDKDYAIESYLSDIDCIANHFEIDKFHLFGHSWGGLYAQIYVEQNPAKILSVFLCSPGSGTGVQWKETESEVLKFNRSKCSSAEWLAMGLNSLLGILGSDKACQRLFKQVIKNYDKGFVSEEPLSFDLQYIRAAPVNLTRKQLIKYPLLKNNLNPPFKITVTYGDSDIYGESKKYVKERYPDASFHTIDKCGHFPWVHNKSDFKKILADHYKIKKQA